MKELVVMHEIQEVACEELINPIMQLPSSCGGKDVVLKFLCTEYKAEYILGNNITYHDTWYGMTYKEDVAAVKESFSKMLENGTYKGDLFSDL